MPPESKQPSQSRGSKSSLPTESDVQTAACLVDAGEAARMHAIGRATWWKLHASGRVPAPIRLGRRTLWRRAELEAWVSAGAPPRERWELLRGGSR